MPLIYSFVNFFKNKSSIKIGIHIVNLSSLPRPINMLIVYQTNERMSSTRWKAMQFRPIRFKKDRRGGRGF